MSTHLEGKRNLVVCRVGDRSLHQEWMGDPATRTYDVWLDCFGEDPGRYGSDPARVLVRPGLTKWEGLAAIVAESPEIFDYDAVWFPDDDLRLTPGDVDRLFAAFHALSLDLAQPALADGSFWSYELVLENRAFFARYTDFVEVMAPVFSSRALRTCAFTFGLTRSGWGVDYVWPILLGRPRDRVAVIDAVPVLHTRPVGDGAWYRSLGIDPGAERNRLAAQHGIPLPFKIRQYGGIPREAGSTPFATVRGFAFLARAARGVSPSIRLRGRTWRRLLRSVLPRREPAR